MVSIPKFLLLPVCALGLMVPGLRAEPAGTFYPRAGFTQSLRLSSLAGNSLSLAPAEAAEPDAQPAQGSAPADPVVRTPAPLNPQPKRILGIMPNFRAVSAGTVAPPPTPKQSFLIATRNSFDYSSIVFVGITSLLAESSSAHKQLGTGVSGYGGYYWRGFLDKTDGNYLVIFALPTLFHQDERYYAMGTGGFLKRAVYSSTRVLITPNYQGHKTFNVSELLGRAVAQGVSLSYYPAGTRTGGAIATKYGYAIGRDVLTNVFREFWPDIAVHVLHRHP
ncbi:MAG TPA: hypothetical protein VGN17_21085 [Bryobacteraceae bacterium]|jgi:hypothetical protein